MIELITGQPPWSELENPIIIMIKIAKSLEPPPIPENISKEA